MTGNTVRLVVEQVEAMFCGIRNRVFITGDPAVKRRDAADNHPLEGGNRFGDVFHRNPFAREADIEQRAVLRDRLQFGDDAFHVLGLFYRRRHRAERVLF